MISCLVAALAIHLPSVITVQSSQPLLMQHPTMNGSTIVFVFAGDLWSVPRSGGTAIRLTSGAGVETDPCFSPDGTQIAFSGQYDGNLDVYLVPVGGGVPKRLTYQPAEDAVRGWTPDGKSVLFTSSMLSNTDLPRLFTVSVQGGFPQALPLPSGSAGCFSPDSSMIAYDPGIKWQEAWKRYRGGQTSKIWMAQLSDSSVTEVPRKNSNDTYPMWVGNKIYFLSDRNGPVTLFSYDLGSKKTVELVKNDGFDIKSAEAGPGGIVLEHLGAIEIFDTASGKLQNVPISISGDFPEVRAEFKNLSGQISSAAISPNGLRAVFEARGEIFTVPASKGDIRNLTNSSGEADRYPAWSPDGQSIAYLNDGGGEYKLLVRNASGQGEPKSYPLGDAPAYYYRPVWSPDSKKITYTDNKHQIWILDLASGKNTKVDENPYENPTLTLGAVWSPDSKWLTYHRDLDSHSQAVFLYSLDSGKATQITDGLSDATNPVFDVGGKYLYFTASTNATTSNAWLDLSSYRSINRTASAYVVVLRKDLPSPLAPESDEEKPAAPPVDATKAPAQPGAAAKPPTEKPAVRIDLDGIDQRILALPMQSLNYVGLVPATEGSFFALEVAPLATITSQPRVSLWKFDLGSRQAMPFAAQVSNFDVTPNGQKILLQSGPNWSIVPTAAPPQPGQGALRLDSLSAKIDPRSEWKQMFHEAWRIQRDFLYDPHFHGVNLTAMEQKYKPFLDGIMSRDDLTYLFNDMLGEICIGHMFVRGGDVPEFHPVPGGLLGADYSLENGRYRFSRVFNGENWNPGLRAPLTQPGVNVVAGEYLLGINGHDLTSKDNIFALLEGTAGKQVSIKVGPNPDGTGSRDVIVVPTANEFGLRNKAWEEDNRRTVEKLTNGRIGYMHIPDTNIGGWTNFNRYYYAQVGKEGIVVDERFNHGGQVDDYMTENMVRPLRSMWTARYGKDFSSPLAMIYGPKVLLINAFAGSGGDYFPWVFRKSGAGPLIGDRTWGGLVGILNFPQLIDGGGVTAPNIAFYNPDGTWDVENHGVAPDIEVPLDPAQWRKGHDSQLERGVAEILKLLETTPKPVIKKPAYMDKTKVPPPGP